MKKICYAFLLIFLYAIHSKAQNVSFTGNKTSADFSQEPYQQLIGYALETANTALSDGKPFGKYKCATIFSPKGYDEITKYPCEVIVHSETGPVVVKYKNVPDDKDIQISAFIKRNGLSNDVRYNKGRFRFSYE